MAAETDLERRQRRHRRTLFDGIAQLYQASRPGYPREIVEFIVATAALGNGSTVLEVGCGTGQLTARLACFGFKLTAIDIGPSMIDGARQRLAGSACSFQVTSFEDFAARDAAFDLIISGAAFHWIDPDVKYRKAARLLRPGGWLAVVDSAEHYDDPFGAALRDMWVRYGDGAWLTQDAHRETIGDTGLFEDPICRSDERRMVRPVELVIGLENTRATLLSWPDHVRREFTAAMRHHLRLQADVHLTQRTTLTMARSPAAGDAQPAPRQARPAGPQMREPGR